MSKPAITACICTCDRYDVLADAIDSLAQQSLSASSFRILVVDNSREPALGNLDSIPCARWIHAEHPGLSAARNLALASAHTPLIAFLDDDARAEPDWLRELVDAFSRNPDADAIGGPVRPVWEDAPPDWLPSDMYGYLSILDRGNVERDVADDEWLCGANIAFRTEKALRAGGFREDLGRRPGILLSNEELDLCRRLESLGSRVLYSPDPAVRHLVPATRCTQGWVRTRVTWQALSDLLMNAPDAARAETMILEMRRFFDSDAAATDADPSLFTDVASEEDFGRQCNEIRDRIASLKESSRTLVDALGRRRTTEGVVG